MQLVDSFKEYVGKNGLFSLTDKLLLAVSGGVDSVVLCELCKQAGYDFIIAHCNFQLRGEESERDERFVRQLAERYKVEVEVKRFEAQHYAEKNKLSIQEAARELRYKWFFELVQAKADALAFKSNEGKASVPGWHVPGQKWFVLTAHHADDNIETVLMNFFRGTGLHGLTGIAASGGKENFSLRSFLLRRPLLPFLKEELVGFARENKLDFVEDSSNQSSKYTRNFFRNDIIPAISKAYPQVKENLLNNIERFNDIEKLYKLSVSLIRKKLCKQKEDEVHIPIKQLIGYSSKALVYEIISAYGFSEKQIEEVFKLAKANSGSYIASSHDQFRIIKHRHWFIIAPALSQLAEHIIIEEEHIKIDFQEGTLRLEMSSNPELITDNHIACLDAKEIRFPLLLRKWKTGDYFYPLGMKKKKKLARFFIDRKLSKTDKEKVWVIEMNKKIIWVVGHRIDDRFKITDKTKPVLKITWFSGQTG